MLGRNRLLSFIGLGCGLALGVALSFIDSARASRNSSGTYSVPSGTTVTSGTTITSSWANTLTGDLATELTSSLDRSGRGAMLAPLQCSSGSVSAPSLTFSSDSDTGLYRVSANDMAVACGGSKIQEWGTTGSGITGLFTVSNGITSGRTTANTNGVDSTGNGTGVGLYGVGGATNAAGVKGQGTGTGDGVFGVGGSTSGGGVGGHFTGAGTASNGVTSVGAGSGAGVSGTGGATGIGVTGTGGATSGRGGLFTGGATGAEGLAGVATGDNHGVSGTGSTNGSGGNFTGGTTGAGVTSSAGGSPSADTAAYAFRAIAGQYQAAGGNPASGTGWSNVLTAMNIPKAWARINPNAGSATTVAAGFNVTNPQESGNTIILDFTTDFTAAPACVVTQESATASRLVSITSASTSSVTIQGYDTSGASAINLGASSIILNVICFGAN